MNKNIFNHFSKTINDYDTVADKVVMKNNEFHEFLCNSIPFDNNKNLKILDLWSGTWHWMSIVLNKFKNSKVVWIDYSNKMILKSDNNLSEFPGRFELIENDFNKTEFENWFDVIVSAFTIHNSTHEEKEALFGKIYNSLNKGWVFINADFVEWEYKEQDEYYKLIYKSFLEHNLKWEELEVWLKHAFKEDMPMKISKQFEILRKFGFWEVRIILQFNNETVYLAKK